MNGVLRFIQVKGRTGRADWLWVQISLLSILAILYVPTATFLGKPGTVCLSLIAIWCAVASSIRRYHDIGKSGWWVALAILPVLGLLFVMIELVFRRGERRSNRFGPECTDSEPEYFMVKTDPSTPNQVNDVTGLHPIQVEAVVEIRTEQQLVECLRTMPGPFSIGGGRFSMGGQTAVRGTTQLDMRTYSGIVTLHPEARRIRVRSGTRWCDVQRAIAPFGLSVMIMQTYANFTVGGSVSVNCHGRYVGKGPLILSIRALRVALADGVIVETGPSLHPEIFNAVVGCYGAIGIILEVELDLDVNLMIERHSKVVRPSAYLDHLRREVLRSENSVFHNADVYPRAYTRMRAVTWSTSQQQPPNNAGLHDLRHSYPLLQYFIWTFTTSALGAWRRQYIYEPLFYLKKKRTWRNVEAGYDVAELEPRSRRKHTYVLQEYFVPIDAFEPFLHEMRSILQDAQVDVLNISMRHAYPDPGSLLAWARTETLAYVLYYRQGTSPRAQSEVADWTRALIDAVLRHGGTYYLPYQPHATPDQFHKAYPNARALFQLKQQYDPSYRLRNSLWEKYYAPTLENT